MNIINILSLFLCFLPNEVNTIEVIYVDSKPYVYKNHTRIIGMIPTAFEVGKHYCSSSLTLDYKVKFETFQDFKQTFYSNATYGQDKLKNISGKEAIWMPFIQFIDLKDLRKMRQRDLTLHEFSELNNLVVILPLERILMSNKIIFGIISSFNILFLVLLCSITFSIIIWLVEMYFNSDFERSFIYGFATACWLSAVTFTTVGYGDIAPTTIFGRIVTVIWMASGIIFASCLTASLTDNISGTSSLDISKKAVAVLANSPEVEIALKDYDADVLLAKTVKELSDMVRSGVAFAALLNADIASYNEDLIRNGHPSSFQQDTLIFAYTTPIKITVHVLAPRDKKLQSYLECMEKYRKKVFDNTETRFKRRIKTETLRIHSIEKVLQNVSVIVWMVLIGAILFCGCALEIFCRIRERKNVQS